MSITARLHRTVTRGRVAGARRRLVGLFVTLTACGDGGGGSAAELPGCPVTYATCSEIVDLTGETGGIQIAPQATFVYTPNCIRITTTQAVAIGASAAHPLKAGSCAPSDFVNGPVTSERTYTFTAPGRYGFYCSNHGGDSGAGMSGVIEVVSP